MAEMVEIVDELGKTRLSPLVLPVLKLIDPIMGALPKGSLQTILSNRKSRERLVKTVEGASPVLLAMIRFLAHLSESRLITGLLSISATLLTPIIRLLAPILSRLVVPLSGPALKLAGGSGSVLAPAVKILDSLVRVELFLEKPFKRTSLSE